MSDGKIIVELQLAESPANKNLVAQMGRNIQKSLSGAGAAGSINVPSMAAAGAAGMDKMTGSAVKLTSALKNQKKSIQENSDLWKEYRKRQETKPVITFTSTSSVKGSVPQGPTSVPRGGGGLATSPSVINAYSGPVPPIIPQQGTSLASMVSNFFNKTLSKPQAAFAGVTAAIAGVRVAIGLWSYALTLAVKPIRMMIHAFLEAADAARKIYAKSLQSGGLPVGFITWRTNLADIIGVGENEVLQYGQAIQLLNGQIRTATKGIADSVPSLTAVSYEWKIMKLNLHAAEMSIMSQFAPAMNVLVQYLRFGAENIAKLSHALNILSAIGLPPWMQAILKVAMPKVPPPTASANRLTAGEFERRGLVIGSVGSGNYAQKTERNTGKTAELLRELVQGITVKNVVGGVNSYMKIFGAAMP